MTDVYNISLPCQSVDNSFEMSGFSSLFIRLSMVYITKKGVFHSHFDEWDPCRNWLFSSISDMI